MLKKFWNYHKLLNFSGGFDNVNKSSKLIFVITYMFAFIVNGILDGGGIIFYGVILSLYTSYNIINSQSRFFETVPVSKLYSFVNIYLNVYLISFFAFALILIVLLPFEIFAVNVMGFKLTEAYIIPFFNNWRAILLTGSLAILIVSILLPIFFIRINAFRKTLTALVVTTATIGITFFKHTLPASEKTGEIDFLESLKIMNNYNDILLILVCICVVAVPTSILISYRLYKGKRC